MKANPIICAIDTVEVDSAVKLVNEIKPYIGMAKLGLEFFYRNGIDGIKQVSDCGLPIFLDLKFYDIPNTVAGAIKALSSLDNIAITTIHTLAGSDVLEKAAEAISYFKNPPLLAGVTILTSIADIKEIGVENNIESQVLKLASLAKKSGLGGIVCSPQEIDIVRNNLGSDLKIITPGIRLGNKITDDQKRIMTPKQAIENGANYLVIGRPITKAESSAKAAEEILASID